MELTKSPASKNKQRLSERKFYVKQRTTQILVKDTIAEQTTATYVYHKMNNTCLNENIQQNKHSLYQRIKQTNVP
jgi:predicted transcriptional regulator